MALDMIGGAPVTLPDQRGLYYGGGWHDAEDGATEAIGSPSTGEPLGRVSWAAASDVDRAVAAEFCGRRPRSSARTAASWR